MDSNPFESAIKSDLAILSTLKMGYVSAKDLYGSVFKLTLKLSFLLLAINTGVRLVLMAVGLLSNHYQRKLNGRYLDSQLCGKPSSWYCVQSLHPNQPAH